MKQFYVISVNDPSCPKKYFSIHGGYTSTLKDAISYDCYRKANLQFEILFKANTLVANYGKVEVRQP